MYLYPDALFTSYNLSIEDTFYSVTHDIVHSTKVIELHETGLVDLILKYYHDLSDKYKKMIPLKMVYIPVAKDE